MNQNQTNYANMIKSVKAGLLESDKAQTVLTNMGANVRDYFGNVKALEECKAQFIADAINPIVNKKHIEALAKDIPRKGSKEFNELADSEKAKWEDVNQAKKDARSVIATYYKRVVKYAFPAEKDDSEKPVVSDVTKDIELLNAFIKRLEKAESRPYDLAQVINNCKVTLALIHE